MFKELLRKVAFDGVPVSFASLEDVVIHKVIAGRPRDIEDIKGILIKNPKHDEEYIIKWLHEFDASPGGGYCEIFKRIKSDLS